MLSPCLFNLYVQYIMRNAGLEETQAGIKIAGRNINNFRYADDTTVMAESEEELKSLLLRGEGSCGGGGAPRDSAGPGRKLRCGKQRCIWPRAACGWNSRDHAHGGLFEFAFPKV